MIKKILLLSSIFVFISAGAVTIEEKRDQLFKVLDEELTEVSRLNRQTGSTNPNLMLRMAEILLEKARHLKERENGEFLTLPPEKRRKTNKKSYFKNSTKYFIQAQKTCFYILKRFKKFKGRGDVYYILAYNAKEFQQTKKAKSFFEKAIKYSEKGSKTRTRSAIALAEILYNDGKFKKAIPLYEMALSKRRDMWWTKDSYNLAWSYFKSGRKSDAIDKMLEVYKLSKDSKYVDMSFSVERDISYFYADTKRINEAISFFKKQGKSVASNLLNVSKYLVGQGKYANAERTLIEARKYKLTAQESLDVNFELLNLYERFGKTSHHLATSKEIHAAHKKNSLKTEELTNLIYHVEKMGALLQKQAVGKTYASQPKIRKRKATDSSEYYMILADIRPKDAYKSYHFAAEALYSAGQYNQAIDLYAKAYEQSKTAKDAKFMKMANTGLLVTLGKKGVNKAVVNKYMIPSYINFLNTNPKSKESHKIYQRLFNSYFTKGDIENSEKTLMSFKKHYPQDAKIQEAMMAKIMDHYRSKKDKNKIAEWVGKINSGEYKVSPKYAKRLRYILLTMQFENVEQANTKGDKIRALKGYVAIYKSDESTDDAKKNAAYNIAVLFYETGDVVRSYNWLMRAFTHMSGKDVEKFNSSILAINNAVLNSGYFPQAGTIAEKVLEKTCTLKSKAKSTFFKNGILMYLADGKHDKAEVVLSMANKCKIDQKIVQSMQLNLIQYYQEKEMWLSYEKRLMALEKSSQYWVDLIYPTFLLANNYSKAARFNLAKSAKQKALKFYDYAKNKKMPIPLEALNEVAYIELEKLDKDIARFNNVKLQFPEKKFRSLIQTKLKNLDILTTKAIDILKIGSGIGISLAYRKLVLMYENFANEVMNFQLPKDKGPEYIAAFKKNMNSLATPLLQKAKEFKSEAKSKISKQMILTPYNNYFFATNNEIDIFYYPLSHGVLMDRGGQR